MIEQRVALPPPDVYVAHPPRCDCGGACPKGQRVSALQRRQVVTDPDSGDVLDLDEPAGHA